MSDSNAIKFIKEQVLCDSFGSIRTRYEISDLNIVLVKLYNSVTNDYKFFNKEYLELKFTGADALKEIINEIDQYSELFETVSDKVRFRKGVKSKNIEAFVSYASKNYSLTVRRTTRNA